MPVQPNMPTSRLEEKFAAVPSSMATNTGLPPAYVTSEGPYVRTTLFFRTITHWFPWVMPVNALQMPDELGPGTMTFVVPESTMRTLGKLARVVYVDKAAPTGPYAAYDTSTK